MKKMKYIVEMSEKEYKKCKKLLEGLHDEGTNTKTKTVAKEEYADFINKLNGIFDRAGLNIWAELVKSPVKDDKPELGIAIKSDADQPERNYFISFIKKFGKYLDTVNSVTHIITPIDLRLTIGNSDADWTPEEKAKVLKLASIIANQIATKKKEK